MNINEAIEKIKEWKAESEILGLNTDVVPIEPVINIISQIDTQPKVVVPKYVDEIIKDLKAKGCKLLDVQSYTFEDKVQEWIDDHYEQFCIAFIFGYEVEKEQLYTVEIAGSRLTKITRGNTTIFKLLPLDNISDVFDLTANYTDKLTEQEIKQKDERLWQFAKPVQEEVE